MSEDRESARQIAFLALRQIEDRQAYADVALQRLLPRLSASERALATELVYGSVRRRRTLDAMLTQYTHAPITEADVRRLLHLGLYQLHFLDGIAPAIAVDSTVRLAKANQLGRAAKLINAILRASLRTPFAADSVATDAPTAIAIANSLPDWLIELWQPLLAAADLAALAAWCNQPPHLDLRVNSWRTDSATVQAQLARVGIETKAFSDVPGALRIVGHHGDPTRWPGFEQGDWTIQDASAQQVVQWLDPQPGETIWDCCAAPGGKTTHIAELMQNQGQVIASDRNPKRLERLRTNAERLQLSGITTAAIDLLQPAPANLPVIDRLLVDVPCSGLGTLHRHADARWQQTPARIAALLPQQQQILRHAARAVKSGGVMVYATCTLNPTENEQQIDQFLATVPEWSLVGEPQTIWPQARDRDGFFMAKLQRR